MINSRIFVLCVILYSIDALAINNPGSVLFCGQSNGVLVMRRAWDLEPLHSIDFSSHGGIRCLRLITGSMDTKYFIFTCCR